MLHGFQAVDHGFDPRPYLLILLQQGRPLGYQRVLALAQRTVLLLQLARDDDQFVQPASQALQFAA